MKTHNEYPITIRPLSKEEGGGFLAEVPDLPGCVADGATEVEALCGVADAMDAWIKTAIEFSDPIPKPSISSNFSG